MAGQTLIYVGAEACGLYRKEAGNGEWTELAEGLPPSPEVRALLVHPQDPAVIYAGTQQGVYRSQDWGERWERMNLLEGRVIWSLQFHPADARVMYAGTEGSEVFISRDGGEDWQHLSTIDNRDAYRMHWEPRIMSIGLDPADPDRMYAAIEVGGAARSFDAGRSWEFTTRDFVGDLDLMDVHAVAVGGPEREAVLIANRTGVWRSFDRGDRWENVRLERFSPIIYSRGVRTDPTDPSTLYACVASDFAGDKGGLMRSTDLGETWERIDRGIAPGSATVGIAIKPENPEELYFCTRRGQVFGSQDGGASWSEHPLPEQATKVICIAAASA